MPGVYPVTASATRPSHRYGTATERFNLFDNAALEVDQDEPPGYRAPYAKLAARIGAKHLAASVALPSSLAGQPNHGPPSPRRTRVRRLHGRELQ